MPASPPDRMKISIKYAAHKNYSLFLVCCFQFIAASSVLGAAKPPAKQSTISAAELNATQGPPPEIKTEGKSELKTWLVEATGSYGATYGGIFSNPQNGEATFRGDGTLGVLVGWKHSAQGAVIVSGSYGTRTPGVTGNSGTTIFRTTHIYGSLGYRFYGSESLYGEFGGHYGTPSGEWQSETNGRITPIAAADKVANVGAYLRAGYQAFLTRSLFLDFAVGLQIGLSQVAASLTANQISACLGIGLAF